MTIKTVMFVDKTRHFPAGRGEAGRCRD